MTVFHEPEDDVAVGDTSQFDRAREGAAAALQRAGFMAVDPSTGRGDGIIHFTLDDGGHWAMGDYTAFTVTGDAFLDALAHEWEHHGYKPHPPVKILRRRGRRRRNVR